MSDPVVRTVIFPVAGRGTRFLPATKSVPKELLPVIDTPLLQFAMDEAREAGVERMVFVTHPSKGAIEHFVRDTSGPADATVGAHTNDEFRFAFQEHPLGLGHAVLCARDHILPGPVAVVLPDDLILSERGCLSEMVDAYGQSGVGHLIASMEVADEAVSSYGILDVIEQVGRVSRARAIVEKPAPADAPSNCAAVGRYILDPCIFDALEDTAPGAGGEIQLTDAIASGIRDIGLGGFAFSGTRYDCGSKKGMLAAILARAVARPEYRAVVETAAHSNATLKVAAE